MQRALCLGTTTLASPSFFRLSSAELEALLSNGGSLMASFEIKSGALVSLQDLRPSSPFFKQGASLRIIGKLHKYSLETGIATVIDGNDVLKVSTEHLRDLTFQVGSVYQFIGELLILPDNEDMSTSKGAAVRYELGLAVRASRGYFTVHVKLYDKLKATL